MGMYIYCLIIYNYLVWKLMEVVGCVRLLQRDVELSLDDVHHGLQFWYENNMKYLFLCMLIEDCNSQLTPE